MRECVVDVNGCMQMSVFPSVHIIMSEWIHIQAQFAYGLRLWAAVHLMVAEHNSVQVFWPILVLYFFVLFGISMKHRIEVRM